MVQRHPVYWFDDADTIIHQKGTEESLDVLYRIHPSRLSPHSTVLSSLLNKNIPPELPNAELDLSGCKYITLDNDRVVDSKDLVVLLDHLYERNVISPESDFHRISSIIRISRPDQLDFPQVHKHASECFVKLFPSDPEVLAKFRCDYAEEAMALALQNDIVACQKPLLYYLVAQTHLEVFPPGIPKQIAETITQSGHALMHHLIDHFTPILFTPPAASHMACTDIIAGQWMSLVIPALEDSGTCKPLEVMETMKGVDWEKEGVCDDCAREKREEWTEEQRNVWNLMDEWISASSTL